MKECHIAATEPNQISSYEFKKIIKACIRNEFLETYKRRYTSVEKYIRPSSRTVARYLNKFSQKSLENF